MNILRTAILTASIIGIISTLADFAAPGESLKKQLKMIITMVLILGLFTPFIGNDFKLSVSDIDKLSDDNEYADMNRNFNEYYIEQSSSKIEQKIMNELKENNIPFEDVRIYCRLDEYNSIEIIKGEIDSKNLSDEKKQNAYEIIQRLIPDAKLKIITEDLNETE